MASKYNDSYLKTDCMQYINTCFVVINNHFTDINRGFVVLLNFFLLFSIISKEEVGTRSKEARYIFCSEVGTSLAKMFVIAKRREF